VANVDRRRQPRERVDHGEAADLAPIEKLVMNKIHRPDLVRSHRADAALTQLRLHAPFWGFVAQLQAHLAIQPPHALGVDLPTLATKQNVNASIAVTHPRFGDLFDPL